MSSLSQSVESPLQSYPAAELPPEEDLRERLSEHMRTIGLANLTLSTARRRLEHDYKQSFSEHTDHFKEVVLSLMKEPEFQKQLAALEKTRREGIISRGKKRRTRKGSSDAQKKKNKSSKKIKKVKSNDPNAPKRPMSAYFMFAQEKRSEVAARVSGGVAEVGKELGRLWGTLDAQQKSKYEELAAKDRKRYEEECASRGIKVNTQIKIKQEDSAAESSSSSDEDSSSDDSSNASSESDNDSDSSNE